MTEQRYREDKNILRKKDKADIKNKQQKLPFR